MGGDRERVVMERWARAGRLKAEGVRPQRPVWLFMSRRSLCSHGLEWLSGHWCPSQEQYHYPSCLLATRILERGIIW